jgi:cytochrome c-550 PedF
MTRILALAASLAWILMFASGPARSHGDAAPQPVDTTGLDSLGSDYRTSNPYRGNTKAIEIGAKGYNSNCARCHGLDVKSGGMAPDLRALEVDDETDAWFITRVLHGARRDDRVKMPPFEGLLSQEAIWAIRSYIDSQADD